MVRGDVQDDGPARADLFVAGYGAVWVPPPGRADSGDQSVGYDPFDRFDLGQLGHPTLYGTEDGLKQVANTFHKAGVDLHIDFVINHDGFKNSGSRDNSNGVTFVEAGDYPGFIVTLPNDIDGDFHSAFAQGDKDGRLDGLIDIDHSKNHRFIRSPVPGFANDIRKGTKPAFGRIADVPDVNNRRFYPDQNLQPILLLDPRTGEQGIKVFPFNLDKPLDGDPVEENAMAYLMRNAPMAGADDRRGWVPHRRGQECRRLRTRPLRPRRLPLQLPAASRREPEADLLVLRGLRHEHPIPPDVCEEDDQPERSRPHRRQP